MARSHVIRVQLTPAEMRRFWATDGGSIRKRAEGLANASNKLVIFMSGDREVARATPDNFTMQRPATPKKTRPCGCGG